MSLMGAIYKSLSGMIGFSKGLDNVSQNVSNVNTPGYKKQGLLFREAGYAEGAARGLSVAEGSRDFSQGELRSTGSGTQLAIDGDGFFVLLNGTERFYTRNGDFVFNEQGFLVDPATGYRVAALEGQRLVPVSATRLGASPAVATTKLALAGALNRDTPVGVRYPNTPTASPLALSVYDQGGETEKVNLVLTRFNDSDASLAGLGINNAWHVDLQAESSAALAIVGNSLLAFNPNGSTAAGFDTVQFDYTFASGETRRVTLSFGTPGAFDGVVSDNNQANMLQVGDNDGRPAGYASIHQVRFESNGDVVVDFSNGDKRTLASLALARAGNPGGLVAVGDALFKAVDDTQIFLGLAGRNGAGRIAGGMLESANFDLSSAFAEILIIQRGYQASSQILNVTNKVVDELYQNIRG